MIIPALDLSGGHVVRLKQGDFAQKTIFDVDPIKRIYDAANQGAELIHIVDLDGAKDPVLRQRALISKIVKASPVPIQTGGGIRSEFDIRNLLDLGVERVVVGSSSQRMVKAVWRGTLYSCTGCKTYRRCSLCCNSRLAENF